MGVFLASARKINADYMVLGGEKKSLGNSEIVALRCSLAMCGCYQCSAKNIAISPKLNGKFQRYAAICEFLE